MVDAGIDCGFLRVGLATHDYPETAAVALKTAQTANTAAETGQFGVGR